MMRYFSTVVIVVLLNATIAFSQAQPKAKVVTQSQVFKNDHCDHEKKVSDLPSTMFNRSLFGAFTNKNKEIPVKNGMALQFSMFLDPIKFKPIQHAPEAGKVRCHNFKKDGKEPNCKCWGKYNKDYDKCKPPQESEDIKCTNYCHSTMCDCRIKCNP